MNITSNYVNTNSQANFRANRTILWNEVMFNQAVADFKKVKNEPVTINQYLYFKELHKKVYSQIYECVNNALINFFDGAIKMVNADKLLKTVEFKRPYIN